MPHKAKRSSKKGAEPKPYSFAEPVVRVLSDKAKGKPGSYQQRKSKQEAGTQKHVVVFHKRKDKNDDADIVGTRNVSTWKKTSGRKKSWKTCKRLKVTQEYLELLTNSNGHPVSFGWQYSTMKTPTSFVRGQGLHVNKESKPRRMTKSSFVSAMRNLKNEYNAHWPLPSGSPYQHLPTDRGVQLQAEFGVLSERVLNSRSTPRTMNRIAEAPLMETWPTPCQSLFFRNKDRQIGLPFQKLVFLDFVRKDGLADIYLVQDANNSSNSYHAHAFMNKPPLKNGPTFVRRKMDRLRKNHDFHGETEQLGTKIIIMKIDAKLKITQQEFPSLPGTGKSTCPI